MPKWVTSHKLAATCAISSEPFWVGRTMGNRRQLFLSYVVTAYNVYKVQAEGCDCTSPCGDAREWTTSSFVGRKLSPAYATGHSPVYATVADSDCTSPIGDAREGPPLPPGVTAPARTNVASKAMVHCIASAPAEMLKREKAGKEHRLTACF